MKKIKQIAICAVGYLLLATGCGSTPTSTKTEPKAAEPKFTLPKVPEMIVSREERTEFMITHFWDNFNFTDTSLISNEQYTEQAYADFVDILPRVEPKIAERGIEVLMQKAMAKNEVYYNFMALAEKYLYDPNSPFRNENLYIAVLRNVTQNTMIPDEEKVRSQYQLDLALKNRVGHKATDFRYTITNGSKTNLYRATGDKILLFFFRPDCPVCKEVKEYIKEKGIDKKVNIVWVDPTKDTQLDSIYDLRASPTLYLLDKNKTVLMKDALIQQIENYLKTN